MESLVLPTKSEIYNYKNNNKNLEDSNNMIVLNIYPQKSKNNFNNNINSSIKEEEEYYNNNINSTVKQEDNFNNNIHSTIKQEDNFINNIHSTIKQEENFINNIHSTIKQENNFNNNIYSTIKKEKNFNYPINSTIKEEELNNDFNQTGQNFMLSNINNYPTAFYNGTENNQNYPISNNTNIYAPAPSPYTYIKNHTNLTNSFNPIVNNASIINNNEYINTSENNKNQVYYANPIKIEEKPKKKCCKIFCC